MRKWAVLFVCAALAQQAFGWGDEGHKAINRTAVSKLPASMPGFLRRATAQIEYLGPEPDRWRHKDTFALKNAQEPDHFIDLEKVADVPELPAGRYDFYKLLYEKRVALIASQAIAGNHAPVTRENPAKPMPSPSPPNPADELLPERVGLQPYITMEVYDRLKIAFREYRHLKGQGQKTNAVEQDIVFYMGWLGHYVGDGANPLHTTIKYNGWVGENPNGYTTEHQIHWMMESQFVSANLAQMPVANWVKGPARLEDPWHDYIAYLHHSNNLVENCYQLEKAGGFTGSGTAESREFIGKRLAAGAQMLLNMWYTAWMESEKPVANGQ
jgi:hypothetical protein